MSRKHWINAVFGLLLSCLITLVYAQQADPLFARAFDLLKAGDVDIAITMFQAGLKQEPNQGLGHFYLGHAYSAKIPPDKASALEHYKKAAELLQNQPEGIEAEARAKVLQEHLAPIDLAKTPSLLNGMWCGDSGKGRYEILGPHTMRFTTIGYPSIEFYDLRFEGARYSYKRTISDGTFFKTTKNYVFFHQILDRDTQLHIKTVIESDGDDPKTMTFNSIFRRCE